MGKIGLIFLFFILLFQFVNAQQNNLSDIEIEKLAKDAVAQRDKFLTQNISFSPQMNKVVSFVFGVKDRNSLSLQMLIVLVAFFLLCFGLVYCIIQSVWIDDSKSGSILVSLVVSFIVSLTGTFTEIYFAYEGIARFSKFLTYSPFLRLFLLLIILGLFYFIFNKTLYKIRKEEAIMKAEESGRKVGIGNISKR